MKKEYFNQEVYNYIESRINKTKINPVFKPIVIDIILRRRHEYQLDDKYFHRDVESFVRNVEDIYFEDLPERTYGDFSSQKKCIRINRNEIKDNMNDEQFAEFLFDTLSHECAHAMNFNVIGLDRTFGEVDPEVDDTGTLEAFTEKESNRIIFNRNSKDAFKYYNKTTGYGFTTRFVNVIAAAFGIKEKELLSAAIKGRRELYKTLNTNLKDRIFSRDKFKDISLNINLAHIEISKDSIYKIDFENIGESLKFIYRDLEQILEYRVEKLEWDNVEDLQEKLEDIKLSQNAISKIMEEPILKVNDKEEFKENVKELAMSGKTMIYTKVMCMEEIIKSKDKNARELISFVQDSESVDGILEFMKQKGIEINPVNIALMPEFELSEQKKDEWIEEYCLDGEERDNTEIYNYTIAYRKEIENAKEKKVSFIDKGKRVIESKIKAFIKGYIKIGKILVKAGESLWKALPKKEKPLLLGERRRRKNRR